MKHGAVGSILVLRLCTATDPTVTISTVVGQINVAPKETSAVLRGLRPGTEYLVTIIAQYANSIGESVSSRGRTRE